MLDYEYTILAYYMNWPIDHYHYLDLLGKVNYNSMIANYKFYVKSLSSIKPQRLIFNQTARIEGHQDLFYPSTPSLIAWTSVSSPTGSTTCSIERGYLMN